MSSSTSISKNIVTINTSQNIAKSLRKIISAERTLILVSNGYLAPHFMGLQNTSKYFISYLIQLM